MIVGFIFFMGCGLMVIAAAIFILLAFSWGERRTSEFSFQLKLAIGISILGGLIYWQVDIDSTYETSTRSKVLVSAAPSHTQVDGSISGGFMYISGYVNEKRIYLLREEVSKGVYKDFEVKKGAYLKEDASLKNKGKFVQHFRCETEIARIELLDLQESRTNCVVIGQDIVVPVGSVIKELKI